MVVSNARNVKVTGRKSEQLVYRHHTMFPGGLKEIKYKEMMSKKPDEVSLFPSALNSDQHVHRRSFVKLCPACCQKTSSENEG